MESCGDCSFLYSRQSRYYILLVSLQAQKIALIWVPFIKTMILLPKNLKKYKQKHKDS